MTEPVAKSCRSCGAELKSKARFCAKCGERAEAEVGSAASQPATELPFVQKVSDPGIPHLTSSVVAIDSVVETPAWVPPVLSLPPPVNPGLLPVKSKTKLYVGIGFGAVLMSAAAFLLVRSGQQNTPIVAASIAASETTGGLVVDSLASPSVESAVPTTSENAPQETSTATVATPEPVTAHRAPQIFPPDAAESVAGALPLHVRAAPVYTNAEHTAESLNVAFETIGKPDATFDQLIEAGRAQQLIFRSLALNPSLESEVLPLLEDDVRADTAAQVETSRRLRSTAKPQATLPKWRIVETLQPSELITLTKKPRRPLGLIGDISQQLTSLSRALGVSEVLRTLAQKGRCSLCPRPGPPTERVTSSLTLIPSRRLRDT